MSREAGHDIHRFLANLRVVEKRYAPQIAAARKLAKQRKNLARHRSAGKG
jgi:hypothetical protein